jgi:hypothetical protein
MKSLLPLYNTAPKVQDGPIPDILFDRSGFGQQAGLMAVYSVHIQLGPRGWHSISQHPTAKLLAVSEFFVHEMMPLALMEVDAAGDLTYTFSTPDAAVKAARDWADRLENGEKAFDLEYAQARNFGVFPFVVDLFRPYAFFIHDLVGVPVTALALFGHRVVPAQREADIKPPGTSAAPAGAEPGKLAAPHLTLLPPDEV